MLHGVFDNGVLRVIHRQRYRCAVLPCVDFGGLVSWSFGFGVQDLLHAGADASERTVVRSRSASVGLTDYSQVGTSISCSVTRQGWGGQCQALASRLHRRALTPEANMYSASRRGTDIVS